ncbi:uncharacterized protein LOC122507486 [Leptopilina heterotoma]|uniref:uncharacterized protein LOC122507486 n=1 Tax=Leptopilina heterotoma TaxID=63436 RepID=UPI001CAA2A06|nr:uncharacterized protein LOC122507486 [Leptopilina heterotoma]
MPIYLKSARCFPNECYTCKSRENLIRCKCNMISYCSEDHRQQHLSIHEDFCRAIKALLEKKGITHIYQELNDIYGPEWNTKRKEIRKEIIMKLRGLEGALSPLENFMFYSPRICFDCHETKQEDLINCPHCPIASFCKEHENDKIHEEYCKVMNTYLNVLTTAEKLNIDLDFLSSAFPFTGEKADAIDDLTMTYKTSRTIIFGPMSKSDKIFLINFIDFASKLNNALQKIHDTIPEELTIHIDELTYDFAVAIVNYWEFLLHLNPRIKKLKIVMTTSRDPSRFKKSLCKNCHLEGRNFILEASAKSYEDYMLDENYQEPDILFYVQINIKKMSQGFNKWRELNCPIILQFDSNSNFCQAQHILSSSRAKFRFIHEGQLKTPFGTLSSIENKDYFIIFQSKENNVLQKSSDSVTGGICEGKIGTNTTEILADRNKNKESNKERKSVDYVKPSASSSKRSFAAISGPGEEEKGEKNKKSKTENCKNCKNCSKSNDKENSDPKGEEGKIKKKNDKVNSSQSYLIKRISYLENEIEDLRQQLNLSVNEVTKLQTKLDQLSFNLNKKEKVIKKLLCVIVDNEDIKIEDTDSSENNI